MASELELTFDDPQKKSLYAVESRLCKETRDERFSLETLKLISNGLWNNVVSLPLKRPEIKSGSEHFYDPWSHQIELGLQRSRCQVNKLIHELAHGWIAAKGLGPYVESHGPVFCRAFGKIWSFYSKISFSVWKDRTDSNSIDIADHFPNIDSKWAVIEEPHGTYALRYTSEAERKYNIKKTFTTDKLEHHHPWTRS